MRKIVVAIAALLAVAACKPKNELKAALDAQNKIAVRSVRLFYESPDMLLVPETRNVPLPESAAGAIPMVMRELLKGPSNPSVPRLLPNDTTLRGAFLLPDGTVIVDLGGPTLTNGWGTGSHQELMAAYSVVQTLAANFAEAKKVRFLINGSPAETLGGHISVSQSLSPSTRVVDPRYAR